MSDNEYLVKITLIGTPYKLKTKFIQSYSGQNFDDRSENMQTLGVEIYTKKERIDNNIVKLIIENIAPQEFFRKLRPSYYRGASGCVICFERSEWSFRRVKEFYKEFRKHIPDPTIPITFVCFDTGVNEIKLEKVNCSISKTIDGQYGLVYLPPSFKKSDIEPIFVNITKKILQKQ